MLNRVTNVLSDSAEPGRPDRPWVVDRNPSGRLFWLLMLMILPLGLTTTRLVYLQTIVAERFAISPEVFRESFEAIPSHDGRILGSDGRVLAYDVQRYDVLVHYRWLETPADRRWLRREARSRIGKPNNAELIAAERRHILARRDAMWDRLAKLTKTSPAELHRRTEKIQQRVETIITRVQQRRDERSGEAASGTGSTEDATQTLWSRAWRTLVKTLTTPPNRTRRDQVIVQEELSYHPLLEDVPLEVVTEIESSPERYPGLRIRESTTRLYPEKSLAAHLVGVRTPLQDDEAARRREQFPDGDPLGYRAGNRIGRSGVEKSYDRRLHGLTGQRQLTVNRHGEILHSKVLRRPRAGRDIRLTLNIPLQQRLEKILDARVVQSVDPGARDGSASSGGSVVILDVHTGEVLAAVSSPRFDLNVLLHPDPETWRRVSSDPRRPFFHRAIQMTLPPGSVFKTVTSVALLESGKIKPDKTVLCRGYLDRPDKYRCYIYRHYGVGHGPMDLTDALARSCNVYFFTAGRTLGPEPLVDWAQRCGFGKLTGIDLPSEHRGNLPAPPSRSSSIVSAGERPRHRWYKGDTLGLAIGQTRLTVTPMQIVRMMAAIANDGYLVTPHVVTAAEPTAAIAPDDDRSEIEYPPQRIRGLSPGTMARIRKGLKKAVARPHGTGYKRVRLKEISIAGKTGTAETGGGKRDHAWFAGYVPAERPRYAFVVVLEHAGGGSRAAGPVARQLVQTMLSLGLLQPTDVATRE